MRIALLSHASDLDSVGGDGLAPGLRVHARALAQIGHSVHVFAAAQPHVAGGTTAGRSGSVPTPTSIEGVECSFFARDGALRRALVGNADFGLRRVAEALADASDAYAGLRRRLRDSEFDIIEIVGDGAAAGLVALCDGIPALVRTNGIWSHEGSTAERFAAGRLARLGMRAARAVSVASLWLRDHLSRLKILQGPALVVPDATEAARVLGAADGRQVFVWFDGAARTANALVALLGEALSSHPELHAVVSGPQSRAEHLTALRSRLAELEPRCMVQSGIAQAPLEPTAASVGLFWFDHAPVCPPVLLQALAAGMPFAARGIDSVPEAVRHEVDGLLFDSPEAAKRKLERLLQTSSLRDRLGQAAHQRAATRFDPVACARRRLQVYQFAAGRQLSRTVVAIADPAAEPVELGPDNWFDAWWLAGAERKPTRLARDASGRPTLLALPHDELKVVETVLVRSWCDGPKDWAAPEWAELREFDSQVLERLDELRRHGRQREPGSAAALAFPPPDHAMFAADQSPVLLLEAWRLDRHERFIAWLSAAVQQRGFVTRAKENVHLRRIAVEAAIRTPGPAVFDVLRRIYRDARRHDQVVDADREFLAHSTGTDAFSNGIAQLGLHAPFARTRFPTSRRARRKPPALQTAPRITVLIPSYRHEAFVGLAVQSCLRQTIHDVRVLVADDQSPDGTVAAARASDDPRLRVEVNATNLGLGASVLAALARVDTPYVALLNSDDLFHPERLERCLAVLEADANASLVATGFAVVDGSGAVLTPTTSCAVEIGPQAHGWLRWFEDISRDELHRPEDWISFDVLLRHNVLATSSNMVFRTEWLRTHMPEASRLKYCLDWQLFLQAAMEGSLRLVEGPLLAYRLHGTNTVWFREGGRADYVLEVNRVVDRVLGQWLERAVARDGAGPAIERLAHILEHHVRRHGETDGLALYLCDLARRYAANSVDPTAAPIAALAEAALRRNAYGQVIRQLDVDPWSLPWRAQVADRWRLEHDVAEGFGARARAIDAECARLRIELGTRTGEAEDSRAKWGRAEADLTTARREADEERARLRDAAATAAARAQADFTAARELYEAKLVAAAREADEERTRLRDAAATASARAQAEFASARERYEVSLRQEAAARHEIEARANVLAIDLVEQNATITALKVEARHRVAAVERLETEMRQVRAELERATQSITRKRDVMAEIAAEHNRRGERIAEIEARHARLQSDLETARAELRRVRAVLQDRENSLVALGAERERLQAQCAAAVVERDAAREEARRESRLRDAAIASALAERASLLARTNSPSFRLGDTLMRRIGVLQAYKTLAAWTRRGKAVAQRGGWHLHRWSTGGGRARTGMVVFADTRNGAMFDDRCARWVHVGGTRPRRLIAWTANLAPAAMHDVDRMLSTKGANGCLWLQDDPRLDAADRAYFGKRHPAAVDELEQRFASTKWLGRAWRGARLAKTIGAGISLAQGLGCGAVEAYAAKRLCGVRYALALGDEDLLDSRLGDNATAIVLRAADVLIVDSDLVLMAAERLAGAAPARSLVRWAITADEIFPVRRPSNTVRTFVDWTAWRRADPATLVEGVRQAVASGCDIIVDVVGNLGDGPPGFHRWLLFQDQLGTAGLAQRFHLHGNLTPEARRRVLSEDDLVVWTGRSIEGAGLPDPVVGAFAAGKPVIASAVREITWLPALAENVDLVAPGSPDALAGALVRFSSGRESAARRLDAGRKLMATCAAADAGQSIAGMLSSLTPD